MTLAALKPACPAVAVEEVAELLGSLVAIPSVNPAFRRPDLPAGWFGEERLARFVADWLHAQDIECHLEEVQPGRFNVVAGVPGPAGAKRMIWEGHLDTVQTDGMEAPFEPRIENGVMYGRGAVDDKACLAMFMLAMREARRRGTACDLTFLAAVDEEVNFEGVLHHVHHHPAYDFGIAGEPTELALVSACKGCVRWIIEVEGRGAHASKPEEGIDAVAAAGELLEHLKRYIAATPRTHPLLGRRTLTCTLLKAGEGANSVPASAHLTFDFRTLPDQTGAEAWAEIAEVVRAFEPRAAAGAVFVMHPPFVDSVSMEVDEGAEIVTRLAAALKASGLPGHPVGVPFGSDASKMTRGGTPTLIFGPGRIEDAHAAHENVVLDDIVRGVGILTRLATDL